MGNGDNGHSTDWITSLLEEHEGRLLRYAQRLTGDAERARDAVQETFLRLCREERGAVEGHEAAWLYRVCRHRALDAGRKEARMKALHPAVAEGCAAGEPPPDVRLEDSEAQSEVAGVLATLPAREQEIVRLKFQEQLSYRQISEVTGLSVTNVGFLIHTAIKKIRKQLQSDAGQNGAA